MPANLLRTMTRAQTTPKTVFAGTAIAAMSTVSQRACSVSGDVSAAHTGASPFSNVR